MFSPLLSQIKIPDTVWLPPDIRMTLEGRDEGDPKSRLDRHVNSLLARVEQVENLVKQIDIDNRLRRLESPVEKHLFWDLPSRRGGA